MPRDSASFPAEQGTPALSTPPIVSPANRPASRAALIVWLLVMLMLWSVNYIAGKIALRTIDPISLATFRLDLAALVMLAIYFARPRSERTPPRREHLWPYIYLGFFGVILNQGLFTVGLNYTTSAHSAVIIAFGPVIILILARMLGQESLTAMKVIGMALSFAGVTLLEWEQGSPAHSPLLLGDLITLGGTVGFAAYTVLGKKFAAAYDGVSMNTFMCVAAALMLLPVAVVQSIHLTAAGGWHTIGVYGWLGLIYMAVGSSVAAYTIFYWALRHTTASRVGAMSYFQPVVVIVLAALFLGDHPSRYLLAGTALVLVGVVLAERGKS